MILTVAGIQAALGISWRNNKDIVNLYIKASANFTVKKPTERSWCGDFAYWVLKESGVSPLPGFAKPAPGGGWDTVSRYGKLYPKFMAGEDTPQTGDMYYMRYTTYAARASGGNGTNHVGFVVEYNENEPTFRSIDGNTGTNPAILVKGVGGGYVNYNNNRAVELVDYFIRIPD